MPRSHGQAHNQDYIRRSEYDSEWGGKKKTIDKLERPLPFDCCALSMQPFQDPVCTADGTLYDMANIFQWLKKYKVNPITGEKMTAKDLIVLNMHKNSKGKWHCPITLQEFTDGSHIVAIKTTGQVYSYEAVLKVNIERKDWKDLTTGEPFTRSDIITLHDPNDLSKKRANTFFHVKEHLDFKQNDLTDIEKKMNLDSTTHEIIKQVGQQKNAPTSTSSSSSSSSNTATTSSNITKSSSDTATGSSNAPKYTSSFTATNVDYAPVAEKKQIIKRTNKKGRVQLITNFGTLDLLLHCDSCPKTCENFMLLVERGYYDGITFHRSIKNFMIQGGDPGGDGKGGQSAFGKPFEDEIVSELKHDGRGVLSMANKGPNTNTSQFFILYRSARHLDGKHTVFGRLNPESMATLAAIENVQTDDNDKPLEPIKIIKAGIIENPLDDHALEKEKQEEELKAKKKLQEERDRKERGLWFSNPSAMTSGGSGTGIGKYLATNTLSQPKDSSEKKRSLNMEAPAPTKKKKLSDWSAF